MITLLLSLLPIGEPAIVEHCDRLEINSVHNAECGTKQFTQVILWRSNYRGSYSVDKWKIAERPIVRGCKVFIVDSQHLREIRSNSVEITTTLNDPEVDERRENNQRFEWNLPLMKEP